MSERNDSRRNRNFNSFKNSKRPTILTKNDRDGENKGNVVDGTKSDMNPQPKILLKPKEKDTKEIVNPIINIAVREKEQPLSSPNRVLNKEPPVVSVESSSHNIQEMKKPIDLITPNFTVNNQIFDYLNDINSLFMVVGVIGIRGVGKSTILNLLATSEISENDCELENKFFLSNDDNIFPTRDYASSSTSTDGIEMFITKDRLMLLDCSPVLHNLHRKDCILNEIDDLKLIILLLSVCHLIIVVQEGFNNPNLIRLIHNANLMKTNFSNNSNSSEYSSNLMFIKNFGDRLDFTNDKKEKFNRMLRILIKNTNLNIYPGNFSHKEIKNEVNTFVIPRIDKNCKLPYFGYSSLFSIIMELRKNVFMSPKNQILNTSSIFTEKQWAHHVQNVWDSHKNNFFLRKYEGLKDKLSLHSHRERDNENGNSKDRNYFDYS